MGCTTWTDETINSTSWGDIDISSTSWNDENINATDWDMYGCLFLLDGESNNIADGEGNFILAFYQ